MKKPLAMILALLFLLTIPATALSVSTDDSINGLKKNTELVELIASGNDYLVGGGVPFEGKKSPDITPRWASGGVNHTHQYLAARALTILKNDKGDKTANLLIQYSSTILANADWPDESENDSGLYIGHFYNPNTGKTILGMTSPTAMSRFLTHTQNAKKYYAKNKTASMQELGRALHYLNDVNVPHHAALLTALNSNHTAFENYADSTRANYAVNSTTLYSGLTVSDPRKNLTDYSQEIINLSARHALGYVTQATSSSETDMQIAAEASMDYSQEISAAYLYNFLISVGAVR